MQVEIVSPEDNTYSEEADMVIVRTIGGGDIAFQPGHVPFIGVLDIWEVRVIRADADDRFAVHRGFVQMANDKVTILSDVSEPVDAIDSARAAAARERAEEALRADADDPAAIAALRRADLRLRLSSSAVG